MRASTTSSRYTEPQISHFRLRFSMHQDFRHSMCAALTLPTHPWRTKSMQRKMATTVVSRGHQRLCGLTSGVTRCSVSLPATSFSRMHAMLSKKVFGTFTTGAERTSALTRLHHVFLPVRFHANAALAQQWHLCRTCKSTQCVLTLVHLLKNGPATAYLQCCHISSSYVHRSGVPFLRLRCREHLHYSAGGDLS